MENVVLFIHPQMDRKETEKLRKGAYTEISKRWYDEKAIVKPIPLGETKASIKKALKMLNEIGDDLVIIVYHGFDEAFITGFLTASNVCDDIKACVSLDELIEHNGFRFRTDF